jgi:hypothetical protein
MNLIIVVPFLTLDQIPFFLRTVHVIAVAMSKSKLRHGRRSGAIWPLKNSKYTMNKRNSKTQSEAL